MAIVNCLIEENTAERGAGLFLCDGHIEIQNCSLVSNSASNPGGGITLSDDSHAQVLTSILWNNSPDQIYFWSSWVSVECSDVQGGWAGMYNIDADPLFVTGPSGDFYLSHVAAGQTEDSPCVDGGCFMAEEICFDVPWGYLCMNELTTRTDEMEDSGIVDIGFHYFPSSFVTPTPTSTPTQTPAPTNTPTITPTFTLTPVPTSSPSPAPTSTHTPEITLGVRLDMPVFVHPGEYFWITGELWNYQSPLTNVPVCFLLQVYDDFWFWPHWTHNTFDYESLDVPIGMAIIEVVPLFLWPDTGDQAMNDLWFYGAMLNPEMTSVLGEWDDAHWGFGP